MGLEARRSSVAEDKGGIQLVEFPPVFEVRFELVAGSLVCRLAEGCCRLWTLDHLGS